MQTQSFWDEYYESIRPKVDKITVRWDTCTVGTYDNVEIARTELKDSSSYKIDYKDFWYKEYNGNEWKRLYDNKE